MSIRAKHQHRSSYTIVERPGFLALVDRCEGRSVTNDAEYVVQDLIDAGYDLTTNRLIYRDTDGVWDEIVVTDGAFNRFVSIGERDMERALGRAAARRAAHHPAVSRT